MMGDFKVFLSLSQGRSAEKRVEKGRSEERGDGAVDDEDVKREEEEEEEEAEYEEKGAKEITTNFLQRIPLPSYHLFLSSPPPIFRFPPNEEKEEGAGKKSEIGIGKGQKEKKEKGKMYLSNLGGRDKKVIGSLSRIKREGERGK